MMRFSMRDPLSSILDPRSSILATVAAPDYFYRAASMSRHGVRDRSEQEAPPSSVTVRSEHDQIGAPFLSLVQDHIFGGAVRDLCRNYKLAAGGLEPLRRPVYSRLRLFLPSRLQILDIAVGERPRFGHGRIGELYRGDDLNFTAFGPRAFSDRVHGGLAAIRTICSQQDFHDRLQQDLWDL